MTPTTASSVVCCKKDYVPTNCYNSCSEPTCANLILGDRVCAAVCETSGKCQCGNGLYKNDCDVCVPKEHCGVPCKKEESATCGGENQILNGCWDPTKARVCPGLGRSFPRDIFLPFVNGTNPNNLCIPKICDCKEGYLRDECGHCVTPDLCGAGCGGKQCDGVKEETKTIELPPICPPTPIPIPLPCRKKSCKKHSCKNNKCKKSGCKKSKCGRPKLLMPPIPAMRPGCQRQFTTKCGCVDGYARNNCERCVPVDQANIVVPCACTDPCRSDPDKEYICANACSARTCENFHKLPYTTCSLDCNYGCYCSAAKDLWYNGTACVPSSRCPPLNQMTNFGNVGGGGVIAV